MWSAWTQHSGRTAQRIDPDVQCRLEVAQVAGRQHDPDATLDTGEHRGGDPVGVKRIRDLALGLHVPYACGDLVVPLRINADVTACAPGVVRPISDINTASGQCWPCRR